MKKNIILYILLIFLVIVNGFFLFHFMNYQEDSRPRKDSRPIDFITKELKLSKEQILKVESLNREHHQKMMGISEELKVLKDALFNGITADSIDNIKVDSIASLIGDKEKEKDLFTFHHFRRIKELCDGKQKEKFQTIIKDALRRGDRAGNGPPEKRGDNRPPPPKH